MNNDIDLAVFDAIMAWRDEIVDTRTNAFLEHLWSSGYHVIDLNEYAELLTTKDLYWKRRR